ncbi:MAG: hypothetical protein RL477_597, partial [Pseudomonadota bacterium]
MIRGSTYSAVMHVAILLIILFGLPSLTFLLPLWEEETPIEVVVMTPEDAQKLEETQAKRPADDTSGAKTKDPAKEKTAAD